MLWSDQNLLNKQTILISRDTTLRSIYKNLARLLLKHEAMQLNAENTAVTLT